MSNPSTTHYKLTGTPVTGLYTSSSKPDAIKPGLPTKANTHTNVNTLNTANTPVFETDMPSKATPTRTTASALSTDIPTKENTLESDIHTSAPTASSFRTATSTINTVIPTKASALSDDVSEDGDAVRDVDGVNKLEADDIEDGDGVQKVDGDDVSKMDENELDAALAKANLLSTLIPTKSAGLLDDVSKDNNDVSKNDADSPLDVHVKAPAARALLSLQHEDVDLIALVGDKPAPETRTQLPVTKPIKEQKSTTAAATTKELKRATTAAEKKEESENLEGSDKKENVALEEEIEDPIAADNGEAESVPIVEEDDAKEWAAAEEAAAAAAAIAAAEHIPAGYV